MPIVARTGLSRRRLLAGGASAATFLAAPAVVRAQSATLNGQVVAGNANFQAGANITTVPLLIPGNNPNGYGETMTYRREVL